MEGLTHSPLLGLFVHSELFVLISFAAAVRKNPLARSMSLKTLQVATAKWLFGARDRGGGHKARVARASHRAVSPHADS